jgi:hypothetical protein
MTSSTIQFQHAYTLVKWGRFSSSAPFGLPVNGQAWDSHSWSPLGYKAVTESNETSSRTQNKVVERAAAVLSMRLNDRVCGLLMPMIDIFVDS